MMDASDAIGMAGIVFGVLAFAGAVWWACYRWRFVISPSPVARALGAAAAVITFPEHARLLFLAPMDLARAVFARGSTGATEAAVSWTSSAIERLDPGAIALLVAIWLVVARSTDFLFVYTGGGGGAETKTRQIFLGLTIVFAAGTFLSIAALAALPWVKTLSEGEADETILRADMEQIVPPDDGDTLSRFPADPTTGEGPPFPPAEVGLWDRLRWGTSEEWRHRRRWNDGLRAWQSLRGGADGIKVRLHQEALEKVMVHASYPTTNAERAMFGVELRRWYKARRAAVDAALASCQAELQYAEGWYRSWTGGRRDLGPEPEIRCELPEDRQTHFRRSDPGERWGVFAVLARWLLETRSLPLTLLTGTVGFGLLGAVVAAMLRRFRSRNLLERQHEDGYLFAVVVRGFSAAIVVYLGVQGGIAAFGEGRGDPDSHILLFTCFAAAVFSEDVWSWVQSQLSTTFATRKSPRGAALSRAGRIRLTQRPAVPPAVPETPDTAAAIVGEVADPDDAPPSG
jgi:hypothetical protein